VAPERLISWAGIWGAVQALKATLSYRAGKRRDQAKAKRDT
jgi:hypothetical protein